MAVVADAGDPDRHDQSMALGVPWPRLDSRPVDLTSLSDLNRLVRTRMLGGVGAGEGDLPGYPIRPGVTRNLLRSMFLVPDLSVVTNPYGTTSNGSMPLIR